MTATDYLYRGEITTLCTCIVHDDDFEAVLDANGDTIPADTCDGSCWETEFEDFAECVRPFIESAPTGLFHIEGYPTWSGPVAGMFRAITVSEFLSAVTLRGDFTLRWEVTPTRFEAVLSHHDGSGTLTVTAIPEDEE